MPSAVRKRRRNLDITQSELAKAVNISRAYLISIEKGRQTPSVDIALKIATVLDCEVKELFFTQNVNHSLQKITS